MAETRFGFRFALVVVILAMSPGLAMAYIDPGNGAYMVQALFTVVAAGIFYLRHPIQSMKSLARWVSNRWKGRSSDDSVLVDDTESFPLSERSDGMTKDG